MVDFMRSVLSSYFKGLSYLEDTLQKHLNEKSRQKRMQRANHLESENRCNCVSCFTVQLTHSKLIPRNFFIVLRKTFMKYSNIIFTDLMLINKKINIT